jgi:hypothetical protein
MSYDIGEMKNLRTGQRAVTVSRESLLEKSSSVLIKRATLGQSCLWETFGTALYTIGALNDVYT